MIKAAAERGWLDHDHDGAVNVLKSRCKLDFDLFCQRSCYFTQPKIIQAVVGIRAHLLF
jgi:hypothetical protein